MFKKKDTKIHFVGIGGMGMCGIAEVLSNLGYKVSGSDMAQTDITRHLSDIGATVYTGHAADNVRDVDVVVTSTAIKGYNPEVEAARARKIPVIPRAEMLSELMRMKFGINVAGSHGKTTTTTMIAAALMRAGLDPTAVIGGRVNGYGLANARLGESEYLVAEADESDGSFLRLLPKVAVVTNIDAEHLDHYGDLAGVKRAFVDYINRVPFYGVAALCLDDPIVQSILPDVQKRYVTYGMEAQADYRARNVRYDGLICHYMAWRGAEELGEVTIRLPGRHNIQNSLAVLAVCDYLGVDFDVFAAAMEEFEGIQRRFTIRGEHDGITVVDDFGHHPTEVRATLAGARAGFPGRRIVAAFQPHRFSRTRDQFEEFARSFNNADVLVMCDVFGAGEAPIDGATADILCQAVREHGHKDVTYVPSRERVAPHLRSIVQPGDLVITLGAGNIQLSCDELLALMAESPVQGPGKGAAPTH